MEPLWKVGWRGGDANGWAAVEWGVPYWGTASGVECTLEEAAGKVAQLAEANETTWNDGRILIWRVPQSDDDESEPMRANEHPDLFRHFHDSETKRHYSTAWHHPHPYVA